MLRSAVRSRKGVFVTAERRAREGQNVDGRVVSGFGRQWSEFDQSKLADSDAHSLFDAYFDVFPWDRLGPQPVGFDFGCGTGRWARLVAPRVTRLHCIDASEAALAVARRNLASLSNCVFHLATPDTIDLPDASLDFGYSLGVLHHIPDTHEAMRRCVAKLRPGAPFLVYLYYRFDNQPRWFAGVFGLSDMLRRVVSKLPYRLQYMVSQLIAATIYWPLSRLARVAERLGVPMKPFPLSQYRHRSFYVMRTDAFDRFCTRLEQRFTRAEIDSMMRECGLGEIVFSEAPPYWTAVGIKQ